MPLVNFYYAERNKTNDKRDWLIVLREDLRDLYYLIIALFRCAFQFYGQTEKLGFFFFFGDVTSYITYASSESWLFALQTAILKVPVLPKKLRIYAHICSTAGSKRVTYLSKSKRYYARFNNRIIMMSMSRQ